MSTTHSNMYIITKKALFSVGLNLSWDCELHSLATYMYMYMLFVMIIPQSIHIHVHVHVVCNDNTTQYSHTCTCIYMLFVMIIPQSIPFLDQRYSCQCTHVQIRMHPESSTYITNQSVEIETYHINYILYIALQLCLHQHGQLYFLCMNIIWSIMVNTSSVCIYGQ